MGQADKASAKKGGLITSLVVMFLVLASVVIVLVSIFMKAAAITGG
jgi:hypothetical protein